MTRTSCQLRRNNHRLNGIIWKFDCIQQGIAPLVRAKVPSHRCTAGNNFFSKLDLCTGQLAARESRLQTQNSRTTCRSSSSQPATVAVRFPVALRYYQNRRTLSDRRKGQRIPTTFSSLNLIAKRQLLHRHARAEKYTGRHLSKLSISFSKTRIARSNGHRHIRDPCIVTTARPKDAGDSKPRSPVEAQRKRTAVGPNPRQAQTRSDLKT